MMHKVFLSHSSQDKEYASTYLHKCVIYAMLLACHAKLLLLSCRKTTAELWKAGYGRVRPSNGWC